MSEIALVSARKVKLENSAKKGSKAALSALKLSQDPDRFLSTVQIGITLIGILTGLYSGEALAQSLAKLLAKSSLCSRFGTSHHCYYSYIFNPYYRRIGSQTYRYDSLGTSSKDRIETYVVVIVYCIAFRVDTHQKYSRGMPFLRAFISKRRNHRRRNKSYRSRRYRGRVCTGGGTRHCRTSF